MYYPTLEEVKKLKGRGQPSTRIPRDRRRSGDARFRLLKIAATAITSSFWKASRAASGWPAIASSAPNRTGYWNTDACGGHRSRCRSIAEELNKYTDRAGQRPAPFSGGAVGYLSYEVVARFEELPSPEQDTLGSAEALFMFVDTMLVFDHVPGRLRS